MSKVKALSACLVGAAIITAYVPSAFAAAQPTTQANTTTVNLSGKKLMTATRMVANDPSSHHPTSWIPAMTMQSILSQLGMDAHFVPGVNQLVLNMPLGYTVPSSLQVPYHKPKSGEFVIFVNSKAIAYAPALGSSGIPNLPVWYVMQALKELGVSSQWTGSSWDISGKATVPSATSMPGDMNQTFSLTLSNTSTGDSNVPAPPVPPEPPVTLKLPMNSLLTASSTPLADAAESQPMNAYVQTGRATYIVNEPIAAVEAWFGAAYKAQGFTNGGSGSSGNFKTGQYVESQMFTPNGQQPGQEQVTMSYQALGANQTKVEYWVYDIVTPPRPSSSEISTGATSMDVSISTNSSQSGNSSSVKTVTNEAAIDKVIAAINALSTIDPPSVNPGGPSISEIDNATLTFHYADGHTVTVKAVQFNNSFYGDVTVDGISFQDQKGTVWKNMETAIQ